MLPGRLTRDTPAPRPYLPAARARNEYAALIALNTYFYMIRKLHPEARLVQQRIQNIVSSGWLGSSVRIDEMSREFSLCLLGHYEPEIFPGFRLAIRNPNLKALVFTQGAFRMGSGGMEGRGS